MSRFAALFDQPFLHQRCAHIPFLMLGYPTLELSKKIIDSVIKAGIDALELGIPFSDPIADGPVIAQAAKTALQNGSTMDQCLEIIDDIRLRYPTLPIGLLVYANLVYQRGIDQFYAEAKQAGIDAILLPDVPTKEIYPFVTAAQQYEIDPILLATPACRKQDLLALAQSSSGYTYVVTRKGVTGTERQSEFTQAKILVAQLQALNAPPPVFGFGIKNGDDVKQAYQAGAKGAIIGSALIQEIAKMSPEAIEADHPITLLTQKLFNHADS
ncbi:MAG: tryptophan synthase subunit alpha [Candidatus Berkiellales bacterium]